MSKPESKPICFCCMSFNTRWIFKPNCWKCNDCGYCTDGFDYSSDFSILEDYESIKLEPNEKDKA